MNSSILKKFVLALSVVFLVSCDSDYSGIGSDMIDDDIHHNGVVRALVSVTAFDKATGGVQSNNMPVNSLGVYDNPSFGKTKAHFVSQLSLVSGSEDPDFTGAIIDTVYLYVPYVSELESTDENGDGTYSLQTGQIYKSSDDAKVKLSVYENGYYLRDSDPGSADGIQKYYSDDKALVDNFRGTLLGQEDYVFDASEIKRQNETDVIERLAPGIYMELDKNFFKTKILESTSGRLLNNSVFQDYFRGIYITAEQYEGQHSMALLDFTDGKIVIRYHTVEDEEDVYESYTLNLTGNTINFFENTYNNDYLIGVNNSNTTDDGDETLFVKGGEGSVAYININRNDLDFLTEESTGQRAIINEANLVFTIDHEEGGGDNVSVKTNTVEPSRIYLYDVNNRRPVYDYYTDATTNLSDSRYNKYVYSGILERDDAGKSTRYKIRITDHINNLVKYKGTDKDSTNVTLGLSVTNDISLISNAALKTPFDVPGPPEGSTVNSIKSVPVSSVTNPFGTILYGSSLAVPEDKRLKLEIYYTKPN